MAAVAAAETAAKRPGLRGSGEVRVQVITGGSSTGSTQQQRRHGASKNDFDDGDLGCTTTCASAFANRVDRRAHRPEQRIVSLELRGLID